MASNFSLVPEKYHMADDPKKKKADSKRVSQQPHEQAYQKRKSKSKTSAGGRKGRASKKA
jgi:hypothetical protein